MNYTTEQLERWAFLDELTELPNRRRLSLTMAARDSANVESFFVAIDLNGFKRAQDAAGSHAFGDDVLKRFAAFLSDSIRTEVSETRVCDILAARVGGDEFVVVVDSSVAALAVAQRVRKWSYKGVTASAATGKSFASADEALMQLKRARAS